jgi:hypothetical protein
MKKLLISAYIAFLLAPTAAKPATLVETFAVPLPLEAQLLLNFGLVLGSTNFQQFNPALGTLNDVQVTLTGSFSWFPELDTPTHTLVVSNMLGLFTIFQSFRGVPVTDDLVPVTLILMGTTTDHFVLDFVTGTSFINDRVDFDLLSLSALPDQIIAVGPNSQIVNLQGTVTYDYTPAVSSVPEPSTWAMMLIGFAGIGFVTYRRTKKNMTALAAA